MVQFIKSYWIFILVLILGIFLFFNVKKTSENKPVNVHQEYSDTLEASVLKYWIDQYNREHTSAEYAVLENGRLKKSVDSISSLLSIKAKQVKAFSQIVSAISLDGKLDVDSTTQIILCPEDDSITTVKELAFSWKDHWMNVAGTIGNGADSIHVSGTDTLSRVDYWKRKWFLGAKHYYTDISNSNPHIHTTGYRGMEFKPAKYNWSIGLGAQVGYPVNQPIILNKPVISLGISVQRTIIRF